MRPKPFAEDILIVCIFVKFKKVSLFKINNIICIKGVMV